MPISSDTIRLSTSDAQSVGAGASANSASVDGRAVMRSGATNGSTFGVWLSRVVSL